MHGSIGHDDENARENREAYYIFPQGKSIDAESAENGCTWDFDIKTVFVIDESEVCHLVDTERLEAVMED